jgi:endonuclease/exonuclease/phosphatase family metal-dependent hydrolase
MFIRNKIPFSPIFKLVIRSLFQAAVLFFLLCLLVGLNDRGSPNSVPSIFASALPGHSEAQRDESGLLETGNYAQLAQQPPGPKEIKLVSYNIRWRGGEDLQRLIHSLRNHKEIGGAAIIGLQEVDRRRKRTGNVNTAQLIARELGLNYAWAAPPLPRRDELKQEPEEETGVAIFSPYAISDVERIVLPNPGPGGRRRAAIGATILIGQHHVRVYSVHAETRIPMKKKMEQLQAVIDALACWPTKQRAVIMGDFNTIKGKDVSACIKLFEERGFTTPIPHDRSTWKTFIIKLKLDWLWMRGLETTGHSIVRRIGLSDHWPLSVTAKL